MADKRTQPPGLKSQINISKDTEVEFWAAELACSEVDLRLAVAWAGPRISDIRRCLAAAEKRAVG